MTGKRVYTNNLREAQARRTRQQIVEAGARLFTERGFASTTVDAIAEEAGVSRKTVFTSVGGKTALLKLAYDYAMAGDDEPLTMEERPELQSVIAMSQTDPYAAFQQWGAFVTAAQGRISSLYLALRGAAEVDAEAAELYQRWERQRVDMMREGPVAAIVAAGALRQGVTPDAAAQILALLLDPSIYHRLVVGGPWTADEFRIWLVRTMTEQVMRPRS